MSNIKDEKTQYDLIREYLLNPGFHFNARMIKSIIEFLFEKFGTEFWKYIEKNNLDLFEELERDKWYWARRWYHSYKYQQKEDRKQREYHEKQRREEMEEEEYRKSRKPDLWGH